MNRKNIIAVVFTIFASLILFFIALNILKLDILRPVKIVYSSVVLGNKENFLQCDQLPSIDATQEVFDENEKINDRLSEYTETIDIEINKATEIGLDHWDCEGKADIVLTVESSRNIIKIKKILGGNYKGIPYRIINT